MDTTAILIAVGVALVTGLVPAYFGWRTTRDKTAKDVQAEYYAAVRQDLKEANERIDKMQEKVDVLQEDFDDLSGYVGTLEGYVDELLRIVKASGLSAPPRPMRPARRNRLQKP